MDDLEIDSWITQRLQVLSRQNSINQNNTKDLHTSIKFSFANRKRPSIFFDMDKAAAKMKVEQDRRRLKQQNKIKTRLANRFSSTFDNAIASSEDSDFLEGLFGTTHSPRPSSDSDNSINDYLSNMQNNTTDSNLVIVRTVPKRHKITRGKTRKGKNMKYKNKSKHLKSTGSNSASKHLTKSKTNALA